MRNEKRRHGCIDGCEGKAQHCSDEASGGWGLFDLRVWNHGTAAAKAVCGGSAIRRTGLELTVDVGFCPLSFALLRDRSVWL